LNLGIVLVGLHKAAHMNNRLGSRTDAAPDSREGRERTTIILVAPEAVGAPVDMDRLKKSLAEFGGRFRLLVRILREADLFVVGALEEFQPEILIGGKIDAASVQEPYTFMPPGSTEVDANEIALAMSDVLVASVKTAPICDRARGLEMPIAQPGEAIREACAAAAFGVGLDPAEKGVLIRIFDFLAGRIENFIMEVLAFRIKEVFAFRSWSRLTRSFRCKVRPEPYIAPEGWSAKSPDPNFVSSDRRILTEFERYDRSAVFGSALHRDAIWLTHLLAAFAVFCAVAGAIGLGTKEGGESTLWSWLELVSLGLIGGVVWIIRRREIQQNWLACRSTAEQLRIALMCLPLMVVPDSLKTARARRGDDVSRGPFLDTVKRVVREHGLPHYRDPGVISAAKAAEWAQLFVSDQQEYHKGNSERLHVAERRLLYVTRLVFAIAAAAVLAHLIADTLGIKTKIWLVFTAAGPALAAGLHGAGARLSLVHRIALSEDLYDELSKIHAELETLSADEEAMEDAKEAVKWRRLHDLTLRAAKIMDAENTSWNVLVHRVRDDLPA
jgi:hypothetical protein